MIIAHQLFPFAGCHPRISFKALDEMGNIEVSHPVGRFRYRKALIPQQPLCRSHAELQQILLERHANLHAQQP